MEKIVGEASESQFRIEYMTENDIEAVTRLRLQSWLDTYPNEAAGVSREWVENRNAQRVSDEAVQSRLTAFKSDVENGTLHPWVARDRSGRVIGSVTSCVDKGGAQYVSSLYVDKDFHGVGVAPALMQKMIESFDSVKPISLTVVSYNERAMTFYKKWGFVTVPNSDGLIYDKLPTVKMIRKGDSL